MKHEEKIAFAQHILTFLRALNRPPKKIRTDSGYTTSHEILVRRARVEFGVDLKSVGGGVRWRVYDEEKHAVATKLIGVCAVCGEPFIKTSSSAITCSTACRKEKNRGRERRWRSANLTRVRERKRKERQIWRRKNPEGAREQLQAWRAANPAKLRDGKRAWREANLQKAREQCRVRARARYAANPEKAREQARARQRAWRERKKKSD